MVILKACPRCLGDLNSDRDIYGEYLECVQCGYIQDCDSGQRPSGKHATAHPVALQFRAPLQLTTRAATTLPASPRREACGEAPPAGR